MRTMALLFALRDAFPAGYWKPVRDAAVVAAYEDIDTIALVNGQTMGILPDGTAWHECFVADHGGRVLGLDAEGTVSGQRWRYYFRDGELIRKDIEDVDLDEPEGD
jgi:hypothetical protein